MNLDKTSTAFQEACLGDVLVDIDGDNWEMIIKERTV